VTYHVVKLVAALTFGNTNLDQFLQPRRQWAAGAVRMIGWLETRVILRLPTCIETLNNAVEQLIERGKVIGGSGELLACYDHITVTVAVSLDLSRRSRCRLLALNHAAGGPAEDSQSSGAHSNFRVAFGLLNQVRRPVCDDSGFGSRQASRSNAPMFATASMNPMPSARCARGLRRQYGSCSNFEDCYSTL